MRRLIISLFVVMLTLIESVACTNIIITRGASADGSTMVSYSADSHVLYGELYHWKASTHKEGSTLEVREWDTNRLLASCSEIFSPETGSNPLARKSSKILLRILLTSIYLSTV